MRSEPEIGTQGRESENEEVVGPRQGPERVISASHLTLRGMGEDSSGGLRAGLPAVALRFLPSLPGRREKVVWSSSWSGNEQK